MLALGLFAGSTTLMGLGAAMAILPLAENAWRRFPLLCWITVAPAVVVMIAWDLSRIFTRPPLVIFSVCGAAYVLLGLASLIRRKRLRDRA